MSDGLIVGFVVVAVIGFLAFKTYASACLPARHPVNRVLNGDTGKKRSDGASGGYFDPDGGCDGGGD